MSNPERDELYEKIVQEILQENKKKHEAELNKKVRTKIFFIGIVCATLILILVANSLAWFNNLRDAKVNKLTATVTEAPTLEIADYPLDGGWKDSLQVHFFPLRPLCGDGTNFYAPLIEKVKISSSSEYECYEKQVVGTQDFDEGETLASSALVKEFMFRTSITDGSSIFLNPDSAVIPDVERSEGSSINSDGLNTSMIAGAMRIAFYSWNDGDSKYNLEAIWIANPNIELVESDGIWSVPSTSIQLDGSVVSDGNPESTYYFVSSLGRFDDNSVTSTAIDYTISGYYIDEVTHVVYFWDPQALYQAGVPIYGSISPGEQKICKIIVWVEGTDRECENALLSGKMGLNLTFTQKGPSA